MTSHETAATITESLAQRQLDAYNERDIATFVACYAPDVEVRRQSTNELILKGRDALHSQYGKLFANSPDLHCTLINRIVMGRFAFDQEQVTGHNGSSEMKPVVAIYEISDGLIAKVWFAQA